MKQRFTLEQRETKFHRRIRESKIKILELMIPEEHYLVDKYEVAMITNSPPLKESAQAKCFSTILTVMNILEKRSWLDLTKDDMKELVAKIMKKYSIDNNETNTTYDCKKHLKLWFRFIKLGDRKFRSVGDPEEIRWLKPSPVKDNVAVENLIKSEEIDLILKNTEDYQDNAFFSCLFHTGVRIGELLSLKIRHVKHEQDWIRLMVDGKTGTRGTRLAKQNAKKAFIDWLNHHPFINNPEAPLWFSTDKRNYGSPATYEEQRNKLVKISKKLGWITETRDPITGSKKRTVHRRIYFHLFRHTAATRECVVHSEQVLRKMFGWTASSKMVERYTHITDIDVDDSIRKQLGLRPRENVEESDSKPCTRCNNDVLKGSVFCSQCGTPLSATAVEDINEEDRYTKLEEQISQIKEQAVKEILKQIKHNPTAIVETLLKSEKFILD